jgi:hypothetical protein
MKRRLTNGSTVFRSDGVTHRKPTKPAASVDDGLTPDQRAALEEWGAAGTGFGDIGGSLGKSLGGLSPSDKAKLNENILSTYKPGQLEEIRANDAERAKSDAINKRFGNDMAWLDPEFEQDTALLGDSARSKVYADPNLVASQQKALDSLFGIAKDGGATAQERSRRAGARADSEGWLRGQREADMQNLAERGMSGSGAELLALGNDRQAAAQRNSAADLETDAWLEQRALDATMKGGELAGQMRDTGFNEGQQRGQAQDEFYALNQKSLNDSGAAYADFKRQAWGDTVDRRTAWDMNKLNQGLDVAGGLLDSDVGQNQYGYTLGTQKAAADVNAGNNARDAYNSYLGAGNPAATNAKQQEDAINAAIPGQAGKLGEDFWKFAASTGSGGGAAGGAASGAGASGGANYGGIAQGVSSATEDDDEDGQYA